MEVLLVGLLFIVCYLLLLFGVSKVSEWHFGKSWVITGRQDRKSGFPRFVAGIAWIQKYYDRGYYEVERNAGRR